MTRKDYELIAAAVRRVIICTRAEADIIDEAAYELACALGADNPRFDRERFLFACGTRTEKD